MRIIIVEMTIRKREDCTSKLKIQNPQEQRSIKRSEPFCGGDWFSYYYAIFYLMIIHYLIAV